MDHVESLPPIPSIGAWVLFGVMLAIGVYDAYALAVLPPGSTVSVAILYWSRKFPIVPVVMGMIIGHLVWPQARWWEPNPIGPAARKLNGLPPKPPAGG